MLSLMMRTSIATSVLCVSLVAAHAPTVPGRAAPTPDTPPDRAERVDLTAPSPLTPRGVDSFGASTAGAARSLVYDSSSFDLLKSGGSQLRLEGFPLEGDLVVDLDLERFSPLAPDALVVLSRVGPDGRVINTPIEAPDAVFLRGVADGLDGSRALLALTPDGVQGYVDIAGERRVITQDPAGTREPVVYNLAALPEDTFTWSGVDCEVVGDDGGHVVPRDAATAGVGGPCKQVMVAIETDHEFLANLFGGDVNSAGTYALFLIAASSEVYTEDMNVRLNVPFLRLWETPADPWTGGNTSQQLGEFQQYWLANMNAVERNLAHFLSGRGLGGGIAWLGATCSLSNGYAVSANLNGSFPYPIEDHSGANWDLMVVSHELGHNFGAPHTHSWNPPLDGCGNGDCEDAFGGTIMSYCHTCPGGISNMVMNFHPVNINAMLNHLDSVECELSGDLADPAVNDDYVVAFPDESLVVDVLANDLPANCEPVDVIFVQNSTLGGTAVLQPDQTVLYTPPADAEDGDLDTFNYLVSKPGAAAVGGTTFVSIVEVRPALNVINDDAGVDVGYYALDDPEVLPDFSELTPFAGEIVADINFPSTNGAFAGSGLNDNVGAVFEAWLDAPESGVYTLYAESDDGSRLFVGEEMIVNNDGLHGMVEKAGTIALEAGKHAVRVEFFERGGGAGVIVRIQGGGLNKQVVPAAMWTHGGAVIEPSDGDLDGDGDVDAADLAELLAGWGCTDCPADIDGDGTAGPADLAILLANWGAP